MQGQCFLFFCLFLSISCLLTSGQTSKPVLVSDLRLSVNTGENSSTTTTTASDSKAALPAIVRSTVQVNASDPQSAADVHQPFRATSQEIQSSAGTYGDLSRYLQQFPGVVFNSDASDDVLVRGGNPIENLYLLDGIEIPNINHIAMGATTGGLVSMIDSAAIDSIDFQTGGYNASYNERLSSVITIHPRELQTQQPCTEADAGFIGAGIIRETPFGDNGALLFSVHRSLLNLFTNNIGLNGVPVYTNMLTHARWEPSSVDFLSVDSLSGVDSINIAPQGLDGAETNTIHTQYKGWRTTNGISWRHIYSPHSFGTLTLSDSEQEQDIRQEDQLFDDTVPPGYTIKNVPLVPVYSELTHDGITNGRYDGYRSLGSKFTALFGASGHLTRIAYNVAQPQGEQSPLSTDPARSDATTFVPHFWTGDSGYYAQLTSVLGRWTLSAGGRAQTFAFGGNLTVTPRLSAAYLLSRRTGLHASFGKYAQMPPFLDLTSYPQNRLLKPISARQIIGGVDLYGWRCGSLSIEAYEKRYARYPASLEYPSLSLANMVDTLGQEFIWIPMTSSGNGLTRGIELSGKMHIGTRFFLLGNIAYARALFSGLDGVRRPGNFDYPFVLNASGRYLVTPHYEVSFRYEATSGRPYTPFLLQESAAQNRPICDLTKINAERGPLYSRLDFRASRTFSFGSRRLVVYGGLENAFDRQNFLGIAWLPRYGIAGVCKRNAGKCVSYQNQMGLFPNFGTSYVF
jgi:hypothetical protein